jgi:hypothetical protein
MDCDELLLLFFDLMISPRARILPIIYFYKNINYDKDSIGRMADNERTIRMSGMQKKISCGLIQHVLPGMQGASSLPLSEKKEKDLQGEESYTGSLLRISADG